MATACDILTAAWDYISDKDNWTQGTYARAKDESPYYGERVTDITRDDIKVCAAGACYRAAAQSLPPDKRQYMQTHWGEMESEDSEYYIPELQEAMESLQLVIAEQYPDDPTSVTDVNDSKGYEAVERMFKRGIEVTCA